LDDFDDDTEPKGTPKTVKSVAGSDLAQRRGKGKK